MQCKKGFTGRWEKFQKIECRKKAIKYKEGGLDPSIHYGLLRFSVKVRIVVTFDYRSNRPQVFHSKAVLKNIPKLKLFHMWSFVSQLFVSYSKLNGLI